MRRPADSGTPRAPVSVRTVGSPFWRVWFGESMSGLGDAAFAVAFSWVVLSTTGSPEVLAGTLVVGAVPRAVLLLLGGAVVDRVSARTVLLAAHLVRGFSVGGLAAVVVAGDPGLTSFLAAAVAVGAADAFAGPAALRCCRRWFRSTGCPGRTRSSR